MNKLIVLASLLISAQTTIADINSEIINAATDGQTETLETLISGSADVQSDCRSALISAAFSALERQGEEESFDGQVEAVQILVNAGVDVDEHFDNGITALSYAEEKDHAEIIEVLKQAGAK